MPLPKYLRKRGDTWCVRFPVPLADQAAFGRKEVWKTLGTTSRREAEVKSHAVIASIKDQIEAKRRKARAASQEEGFLASGQFDDALARHVAAARALESGAPPFAKHAGYVEGVVNAALHVRLGFLSSRPASRAEAAEVIENDLAELEGLQSRAGLVRSIDADGEPDFGSIPVEYVPALMARLQELFEADRRTMEAQLAVIRGTDRIGAPDATGSGNVELEIPDRARRGLEGASQADRLIAGRHAHRYRAARAGQWPVCRTRRLRTSTPAGLKADLLHDAGLKNATRGRSSGACSARC